MNTHQLEEILKRNIPAETSFLGVFAIDHLPTSLDLCDLNQWVLVCNCCPASQIGQHWIAIFYQHGSVEFFDSFALPPEMYDGRLINFLHHTSSAREVVYSNEPLQAIDSNACGQYTILFCIARSRGDTFQGIIDKMVTWTRDSLVKLIVNVFS